MRKIFGLYVVDDPNTSGEDNYIWCCETYGPPNENGRWFYAQGSHLFYFKNEKDAMLFELGFAHASSNE